MNTESYAMTRRLALWSLLLLLRLPLAGQAQAASLAQAPLAEEQDGDEQPVREDRRADIAKRLAAFDALVKAHHKQQHPDPEPLIDSIDGLLRDFGALGPLDRRSVVQSIGGVLRMLTRPTSCWQTLPGRLLQRTACAAAGKTASSAASMLLLEPSMENLC